MRSRRRSLTTQSGADRDCGLTPLAGSRQCLTLATRSLCLWDLGSATFSVAVDAAKGRVDRFACLGFAGTRYCADVLRIESQAPGTDRSPAGGRPPRPERRAQALRRGYRAPPLGIERARRNGKQ